MFPHQFIQVISYHSLKDVFKLVEIVSIEISIHVNNKIKGINECINSTPMVGGYNKARCVTKAGTGEEDTL